MGERSNDVVAELAGRLIVFVGGLHRSGTSLVAHCLGAHPQISALVGTGVSEDEGQHLQDVFETAADLGGPGAFALDPRAHLDETSPLTRPEVRDRLIRCWAPYWDITRPVLLEKSPPNLVRTRLLAALFPRATFVVVVRHPGVVALSTRRWRPDLALDALVRHWLCAHATLESDIARLATTTVVHYEELVAWPAAVLDGVASRLGVGHGVPTAAIDAGRATAHGLRWPPEADDVATRYEAALNRYGYSFADLLAWSPGTAASRSALSRADCNRPDSSADGATPSSESIMEWNRS
jgi:hypothetical protein